MKSQRRSYRNPHTHQRHYSRKAAARRYRRQA